MATLLQFPTMAKKPDKPAPNRIRELRKARGMTLQQLSDALDNSISINQISRLEIGTSALTIPWLMRIGAALDVAPADLLPAEAGGLAGRERDLIDTLRDIPESHRQSFDALAAAHQQFRGESEVVDLPLKSA